MKTTKFRAWDGIMMADWNMLCQSAFNRHGEYSSLYLAFTDPRIILMQFTGLLDKKRTKEYPEGQEVYEGDIVIERSYPMYDNGLCNYRCVVVWYEDEACFGLEMHTVSDRVMGRSVPDSISEYTALEVIGNKWNNPELLGE